jgi:hypothetical protein
MKRFYAALFVLVILTSCHKEDKKIAPGFTYDLVGQANLVSEPGMDYQMQLYFDLSSGTNKAVNKRDAWDLALGCNPDKPNLFVNPAMLQRTASTGSTNFEATYNTTEYGFKHERAWRFFNNGFMMDDWANGVPGSEVFIIDLGKTLTNQARGYKLFQVTGFDANGYHIKVSNLDHTQLVEATIPLNPKYNHVYISLSNPNQILAIEPPKEEWDILFTKYMERLYDGTDTLDYSVTGALLNPYNTKAYFHTESYEDTTWSYSQLTIDDIVESRYTSRFDAIGHDWKYYDLDVGDYSVIAAKNYFIKDSNHQNYRLHFTGFHDEKSRKGGITFEYLPL